MNSDSALFPYGQIVIIIVLEGEGRTPPRAVELYSQKSRTVYLEFRSGAWAVCESEKPESV